MYESIYKNNEVENEVSLDMSYFWYSDAIMSYMEVSKDCCLFLGFVSTRQQGHDHQFISGDISHIICHFMAHQQHLQAQHARSMQSWSQPAYIIIPQSEEHSI
jgi:hypothetical protein